jgi:hypothetical protein
MNVDGIRRRLLNVSPGDMSDYDIRRALALLAADYDPTGWPEDVAERARRFAAAMNRLEPL